MFVNIYLTCNAIIKNVTPPNTLYSFLLHPIRNKKYLLRKRTAERQAVLFFMPFCMKLDDILTCVYYIYVKSNEWRRRHDFWNE